MKYSIDIGDDFQNQLYLEQWMLTRRLRDFRWELLWNRSQTELLTPVNDKLEMPLWFRQQQRLKDRLENIVK